MAIDYDKSTCDVCGHTVAANERDPQKPLVRNQDGSVLCVDCMASMAGMKHRADTLIVAGLDVEAGGARVRNHRDLGAARFVDSGRRARSVTERIHHETVTRSTKATVEVLLQRRLGVHLIVGSDDAVPDGVEPRRP